MSKHLGDYDASAVIYGKFTTYQPSTGAAFTLGGTPALSVYKDNSTTQSTSGVTLTVSFDSVTGLNHFAIDTSSDGTFYSAGSFFDIVITTGTVDSVSVVGAVVASFTIRKDSALKPTTAGRTALVDASGQVTALLSVGTGSGQVNVSSGRVPIQSQVIKNTGLTAFEFVMRNSAGTPTGGYSITAQRSIDGGALAACTNAASEQADAVGIYKINLSAADLNGNVITFYFTAVGAQPTLLTVTTLP